MKFRSILAAFVIIASGSVFAQNATKVEVDKLISQVNALSQKVSQLESKATELEATIERVVTENVNLVEQLNIQTVTSYTDKKNIQWDIVKVEPDQETNKVVVSLRLTNNSGLKQKVFIYPTHSYALDSDTNKGNNKYNIVDTTGDIHLEPGIPVNTTVTISNVPITSSYLSMIQLGYSLTPISVKFTGVHIPW